MTSALLTWQLSAAQSCPEQAGLAWLTPFPASFPQVISQSVAEPGDLHLEHTPQGERRPTGYPCLADTFRSWELPEVRGAPLLAWS